MKNYSTSFFTKTFSAAVLAAVCAASSAHATVVWELNPNGTNGAAGSNQEIVMSQGSPITARGYDNNNGVGTAHELYFKQQGPIGGAGEHGLGLTNTFDNELQLTAQGAVANFIQLDLTAILMKGYTNGKIEVGSIQSGESFQLFGSNTQGVLGISLGGPIGSAFDDKLVSIPEFGAFKFISIASAGKDVLPVAFAADMITPVPEMSALFPIIGLVAAVGSTHVLRRRRMVRNAAEETIS